MTLVLVRHPESIRNVHIGEGVFWKNSEQKALYGGVPDHAVQCSVEGEKQAPHIAEAVLGLGVPEIVFHSGYRRVMSVVKHISQGSPESQFQMSHLVRERDPGYCHDMTEEEVGTNFPWLMDHWKTIGGFYGRPPGGESMADVCIRAQLFLEQISNYSGTVVLVGHKNFFWCLRRVIEDWHEVSKIKWPEGQKPANGSLTVYNRHAGKLVFKEYLRSL